MHILSDVRTQDLPLILETPAHDTGKLLKGKAAKAPRQEGRQKDDERSDEDDEDESLARANGSSESKPDGWEVWRKEVEVLGRIADLSSASSTSPSSQPNLDEGEREKLLDEWTQEIRDVVVRVAGKDALTLLVVKEKTRARLRATKTKDKVAKTKQAVATKKGKKVEMEEGGGSELSSLSEPASGDEGQS